MGCCVSIHQSEIGILETWGVYQKELLPGLHLLNPICDTVVGTMSSRLQIIETSVETKTRENTFCTLRMSIHLKFDENNVRTAFYSVSENKRRSFVTTNASSIVRSTGPGMTLDEIFTSSSKLAMQLRDELNRLTQPKGMIVENVLIQEIIPAEAVRNAMNAMNAAERDRITAASIAEASKIAQIKKAEGEAEARHLAGQGVANARRAIVEGLSDSLSQFSRISDGMSQQSIMQSILQIQYYDMLRDVGTKAGNTTVIYLPPDASEMQKLAAQQRETAVLGTRNDQAAQSSNSSQ